MKTKIPTNFSVTDAHREYSVRKGWPLYLPDVFLWNFKNTHEARETKHKNWDQAFKLWIWRNSPTGPYYHDQRWYIALEKAKDLESSRYKRTTHPETRRTNGGYLEDKTTPTPMPAATRDILERMRNGRHLP